MYLLLTAIVVLATAVPIYCALKISPLPFSSPLGIVGVFALLGSVIKSLAIAYDENLSFYAAYNVDEINVFAGYVYYCFYILVLSVGYIFAVTFKLYVPVSLSGKFDLIRSVKLGRVIMVSFVVFLAISYFYIIQRGFLISSVFSDGGGLVHSLNANKIQRLDGVEGFGNAFAILKLFFDLPLYALTLLLLFKRKVNNLSFYKLSIIFLCVLVVISALLQGKRFLLFDLVFVIVATYFYFAGRINIIGFVKFIPAFVIFFLIMFLMTSLRSFKGDFSDIELDISSALLPIVSSTYFLDINMAVLSVAKVTSNDLLYGITYTDWLWGWVPRFIWEDKPAISVGLYFKSIILGSSGTIGGVNPTGPGEAYLNFSWFGILVAFLMGIFYRVIEQIFIGHSKRISRCGFAAYLCIGYPLIQSTLQSNFSGSLVSSVVSLLIFLMFLKFVSR